MFSWQTKQAYTNENRFPAEAFLLRLCSYNTESRLSQLIQPCRHVCVNCLSVCLPDLCIIMAARKCNNSVINFPIGISNSKMGRNIPPLNLTKETTCPPLQPKTPPTKCSCLDELHSNGISLPLEAPCCLVHASFCHNLLLVQKRLHLLAGVVHIRHTVHLVPILYRTMHI